MIFMVFYFIYCLHFFLTFVVPFFLVSCTAGTQKFSREIVGRAKCARGARRRRCNSFSVNFDYGIDSDFGTKDKATEDGATERNSGEGEATGEVAASTSAASATDGNPVGTAVIENGSFPLPRAASNLDTFERYFGGQGLSSSSSQRLGLRRADSAPSHPRGNDDRSTQGEQGSQNNDVDSDEDEGDDEEDGGGQRTRRRRGSEEMDTEGQLLELSKRLAFEV